MRRAHAVATAFAAFLLAAPKVPAQTPASLAGNWTLDRSRSEFPAEVGFGASFMPEAPVPAVSAPSGGGGRGGRGGGRRQSSNPAFARPDSPDDARRILLLTDAVRTPPINLTVTDTPTAVTITADGNSRIFHPTGKEESIQLDQVPVATTVTRVDGRLLVVYQVASGRELRYTYYTTDKPVQLIVDATFAESGAVDSIRRVYVPGTTSAPPPSIARPASEPGGRIPASAPEPPGGSPSVPIAQGADAPYRGLKKLSVVVEDLSVQAAACGLTRDAIEKATEKNLSDHGLVVEQGINADENTYLYVNVQTTSTTSGLCISRYDAFLYTNTAAKPAYGTAPVLAQLLLAHKGGLAGGSADAHAQSVMSGLKGYVDEFATTITDANK